MVLATYQLILRELHVLYTLKASCIKYYGRFRLKLSQFLCSYCSRQLSSDNLRSSPRSLSQPYKTFLPRAPGVTDCMISISDSVWSIYVWSLSCRNIPIKSTIYTEVGHASKLKIFSWYFSYFLTTILLWKEGGKF